jgi:hypothetical protein
MSEFFGGPASKVTDAVLQQPPAPAKVDLGDVLNQATNSLNGAIFPTLFTGPTGQRRQFILDRLGSLGRESTMFVHPTVPQNSRTALEVDKNGNIPGSVLNKPVTR